MMLIGVLFIMATTFGDNRNSRAYTFKLAIFMIWETFCIVYFVIHEIRGMYLHAKVNFARKQFDKDGKEIFPK